MSIAVNVDNFARAETDRMFAGLQRDAGGVNQLPPQPGTGGGRPRP